MNTGILVIGSLLWDNDQGDKINHRSDWRNERLLQEEKIHVFAPIRYGRNSGGVYTMVFQKKQSKTTNGGQHIFSLAKKQFKHLRT